MVFTSSQFVLFFPIVTGLYFAIPHRFRWALLLGASCYFYMAFIPIYLLILLFTIGIDYVAGIAIASALDQKRKRSFLILSILANVGVLAIFKYFNFVNGNLADLAQFLNWNYPIESLKIILPIGLSFHTFQAMSYTIEVYKGNQEAERHLGIYALYVMFYPQLVAGPIERPQNLLHQFRERHDLNYDRVTAGLKLIAWGFFKKVVIADRLAIFVNEVYGNSQVYNGVILLLATVFFAFQIFCDFSGYSDIAIGAAKVMGFKLMKNFDRPYASKSISEFWRRWHISLSTWFRDYLYIPLGGSRVPPARRTLNLMIVFVVSGLWHGANWSFMVWGALHGTYQIMEIQMNRLTKFLTLSQQAFFARSLVMRSIRAFYVFALVDFAWIFFRAGDLPSAVNFVARMFGEFQSGLNVATITTVGRVFGNRTDFFVAILAICLMEGVHVLQTKGSVGLLVARQPTAIRWAIYCFIVLSITILGVLGHQQFIYFQF